MNVVLPESLKSWVEEQAQKDGLPSADAYVEKVLRMEQRRLRDAIDQRLLAALDSGEPIDVDDAFWMERRRVVRERLGSC